MDNEFIRKDFPLIDGKTFYLNSANVSLKPKCVIDTIENLYKEHSENYCGDYTNDNFIKDKINECRSLVAKLINCHSEEVILTSKCTDSLDRLAQIIKVKEGDKIICSILEHHGNIIPWCKYGSILLTKVLEDGTIDLKDYENILKNNKVKLVSIVALPNATGNVQPVKEICSIAHKYGILVNIDYCQYIPHFPVDVKDVDCDFCCFSSHKICGPFFSVLYGKKELLEGYRERLFSNDNKQFFIDNGVPLREIPWCFEYGSSSQIENIVCFSSALKYYLNLGYDKIFEIEKELNKYFLIKAEENRDIIELLFPTNKEHAPIFAFVTKDKNLDLQEITKVLALKHNIILSCGVQCAHFLYKSINREMGMRASLLFYNTKKEIDYFFNKLREVIKSF